MTREEAMEELERLLSHWDELENGKRSFRWYSKDAVGLALSALRPVSREGVEKVWRGEWIWDTSGLYPKPVCSKCGEEPYRRSNHTSDLPNYCPKCGAPMTDKAVEMVMERWKEALKDGKGD